MEKVDTMADYVVVIEGITVWGVTLNASVGDPPKQRLKSKRLVLISTRLCVHGVNWRR